MALIEGAYSKIIASVDGPNANALDVCVKQRDVDGAYIATGITGLMVAPVINSAVFAIRNGPASDRTMYITEIYFAVANTSASTAAATVTWDLMRFSGTNFQQAGTYGALAAGNSYGIMSKIVPANVGAQWVNTQIAARPDTVAAVGGWAGGQISVCNTAGLTSASVGRDTTGLTTILPYNCTTTTPLINSMTDTYINNASGLEHPIELQPGTGVFIQNSAGFGGGIQLYAHTRIQWYEV